MDETQSGNCGVKSEMRTKARSVLLKIVQVSLDTWLAKRKEEEQFHQCRSEPLQAVPSGGLLVVGVSARHGERRRKHRMSGGWCGGCGQSYDWSKPNRVLALQIGERAGGFPSIRSSPLNFTGPPYLFYCIKFVTVFHAQTVTLSI